MNAIFLEKYTRLHLQDKEEYSEDAHIRFQGECSSFLSTIKEMDVELYRDVMTMSPNKRNSLIISIFNMHEAEILGVDRKAFVDKKIEELQEIDPELAKIIADGDDGAELTEAQSRELADDMAELGFNEQVIEESVFSIKSISFAWFMKSLKTLKADHKRIRSALLGDNSEPAKLNSNANKVIRTLLWVVSAGSGIALYTMTLSAATSLLLLGIIVVAVIILGTEKNIAGHLVEALKLLGFGIMQFFKTRMSVKFNKQFEAIYALETTQLAGCLGACKVTPEHIRSKHKRHRIVRLYTFRLRSVDDSSMPVHLRIAGDCILNCSLKYMISMIAELYSSLNMCLKNTSAGNVNLPVDGIADLTNIDMGATCEPIRDELIKLTNQFRDFISLAYGDDLTTRKKWHKALDVQIKKVLNGQHSRPVAVAPPASSSGIVFEI